MKFVKMENGQPRTVSESADQDLGRKEEVTREGGPMEISADVSMLKAARNRISPRDVSGGAT